MAPRCPTSRKFPGMTPALARCFHPTKALAHLTAQVASATARRAETSCQRAQEAARQVLAQRERLRLVVTWAGLARDGRSLRGSPSLGTQMTVSVTLPTWPCLPQMDCGFTTTYFAGQIPPTGELPARVIPATGPAQAELHSPHQSWPVFKRW